MRLFLSLLVFITALTSVAQAERMPSGVTIGLIPSGHPEKMRQQSLILAQELQNRLDIPVNIFISKDYAGLIEAMKNKKVDFAFFTSSTFIFAEQQAQAKVLLKSVWKNPYYYSALIVPTKSKIRRLKDLKGKKIAYVDQKSSSGYLYPQVVLRKQGLKEGDFKEVIFTGNHQASIQALESKAVDVAAVYSNDEKGVDSAWTHFATEKKDRYRILWLSEPIPSDPFCVRQDFYDKYPKLTHSLMFGLIDMVEAGPDTYSEILGSHSLMPATSKQYDPVREMVKALNIELKPEPTKNGSAIR